MEPCARYRPRAASQRDTLNEFPYFHTTSMSDACPICRANHIGSLLRPDSLRSSYKALVAGEIDNLATLGEQPTINLSSFFLQLLECNQNKVDSRVTGVSHFIPLAKGDGIQPTHRTSLPKRRG